MVTSHSLNFPIDLNVPFPRLKSFSPVLVLKCMSHLEKKLIAFLVTWPNIKSARAIPIRKIVQKEKKKHDRRVLFDIDIVESVTRAVARRRAGRCGNALMEMRKRSLWISSNVNGRSEMD